MRALVTGATGFVGSHLTEHLVREGIPVAILRRPEGDPWRIRHLLPSLLTIEGNVNALEPSRAAIEVFHPDTVFHLAWHGTGNQYRNEDAQVHRNLNGSLDLAKLARDLGCKTFVGLGSQAEYGPWDRKIDEEALPNPTTMYGAAKLSAYHLIRQVASDSDMRFAWMRLFSTYGPKDNTQPMIPTLIEALLRRERPSLTRGEQRWDYIFVSDVASALLDVAGCPAATGVFNLGSGQAIPLRCIVEAIGDLIDPTLPLGFGEVPYRPDQVMHLEADIAKLKQITGWKPRVDLADGLRQTVQWHRRTDFDE